MLSPGDEGSKVMPRVHKAERCPEMKGDKLAQVLRVEQIMLCFEGSNFETRALGSRMILYCLK